MSDRKKFEMTQADYDRLIAAMKTAPAIMLQCGMPTSRQALANAAWCELGDRMGFDGMTVEPMRGGDRFFTAIAKQPTKPEIPEPAIHLVFDAMPSPEGSRFIEAEDENGKSINVGEWVSRADGLVALVIPRKALAS